MMENREEERVYETAFDLVEDAQTSGITKARFAEILDKAWDQARRDQYNRDLNKTITLKPA